MDDYIFALCPIVSSVIPICNEASLINILFECTLTALAFITDDFEVICIDDEVSDNILKLFNSVIWYKLKQTVYRNAAKKVLPWSIIGIGVFLRTFHYLQNRSLYTDEAYLANNLLHRDFYELTLPLDASQHAPLFFLFIVKLLMNAFGTSEFVLRFLPFVSGIAALIAIYYLFKKCKNISVFGLLTGLTIFTLAFPLIYYSSELKQYSTEVLCTVICYLLYFRYNQSHLLKDKLIYSFAGGILVWFSYSCIFVLASIGIVSAISLIARKSWSILLMQLPVYAFWALSFFVNFILIIVPNSLKNDSIIEAWKPAYMPLVIHSVEDIKWYIDAVVLLFDFPLGLNWNFLEGFVHPKLTFSFIGLFSVIVGTYIWCKKESEQLLIIILPLFLTLLASALEKYPFTERFLLFLAPNLILLSSTGISALSNYVHKKNYSSTWTLVIIIWLLLPSFINDTTDLIKHQKFGGWKRREIKDIMTYLSNNKQANEHVVLYLTASAFNYYNIVYGLNWPTTTILSGEQLNKGKITHEVKSAKGNKFWIVVTGTSQSSEQSQESKPLNERDLFINFFNQNFNKIKEYKSIGVYTALYEI